MFVTWNEGTKKESVYSQKKIYCITQNGQLKENPKKIKKNKNKFRKSRSLYFVRFSLLCICNYIYLEIFFSVLNFSNFNVCVCTRAGDDGLHEGWCYCLSLLYHVKNSGCLYTRAVRENVWVWRCFFFYIHFVRWKIFKFYYKIFGMLNSIWNIQPSVCLFWLQNIIIQFYGWCSLWILKLMTYFGN